MLSRKCSLLGPIMMVVVFCWVALSCSSGNSDPVLPHDDTYGITNPYDGYQVEADSGLPADFLWQEDSYVPQPDPVFREAAVNKDFEPNNAFNEAVEILLEPEPDDPASGTINWPKSREGSLNPGDDAHDFYLINLVASAALAAQLVETDSDTILRLWRYDAQNEDFSVVDQRISTGIPKAINYAQLESGTYYVEVENSITATEYKLRIASGQDISSEPRNNFWNDSTPFMHDWERGTLNYESGEDIADYWRIEAKYGGSITLDVLYFRDVDDSMIAFDPVLIDGVSHEPIPLAGGGLLEDGNTIQASYGAGSVNLHAGRYYAGVSAVSGEGLYFIKDSVYAGSFLHRYYPNPVKLVTCQCPMSVYERIILTNRGNVPVSWSLESDGGKFRFDLDKGFLAPGYSTVRRVYFNDPTDPMWTLGVHDEEVLFKLSDISSYELKCQYSIPIEAIITEYEYDASWEPARVELTDIEPEDTYHEVKVEFTNTGCRSAFYSLEAASDSPWLSFNKPPQYLGPGRSTLTTFVVDTSGMSSDTNGSAILTVFDTTWHEQGVFEIPIAISMASASTSTHPWPMIYGDRKHNATSDFAGPVPGAEILWQKRYFGNWQGQNVEGKTVNSALTIDENGQVFFSARIKPLTFRCGDVFKYATVAVDGNTGDIVAIMPYEGNGTSVGIDANGDYWFAFENGGSTYFQGTSIAGASFVDFCGMEMSGGIGGSPVIGNEFVFLGESNKYSSSRLLGLNADCTPAWDLNMASVEGRIWSTPAVGDNGIVYFGDSNGRMYGFQISHDNQGTDPHLYCSADIGEITASPSIDSLGRIYIVNMAGDVYRFSPDLMNSELLFSGAYGGWGPVVDKSDVMYFEGHWALRAYDVSGDDAPVHLWTFDYPNKPGMERANDAPVIDVDGNVYIGTEKHWVYCIDPLGQEVWSIRIAGSVEHSPAIGENGWLYVGDDKGYLYAIQ